MMDTHESPRVRGDLEIALRLVAGTFLGIMALGAVVGFVVALMDKGALPGVGALVMIPVAGVPALASWWLLRPVMRGIVLRKSPRMRKAQVSLYVSLALSFVIGLAFYIAQRDPANDDFNLIALYSSQARVSPTTAIAVIVAWLAAMALSLRWLANVDEHERQSYNEGASFALHCYFILVPAWWMAWRADLMPEPDGAAIFWTLAFIWLAAWLWRRYR